jgi:hypothetical protein
MEGIVVEELNGSTCRRTKKEVQIEILFTGFPKIYDFFSRNRITYTFSGKTVLDLVQDLIAHYGEPVMGALLEERTQRLDPTIQVRINEKYVKGEDLGRQGIEQGDKVLFLRLLAGG